MKPRSSVLDERDARGAAADHADGEGQGHDARVDRAPSFAQWEAIATAFTGRTCPARPILCFLRGARRFSFTGVSGKVTTASEGAGSPRPTRLIGSRK